MLSNRNLSKVGMIISTNFCVSGHRSGSSGNRVLKLLQKFLAEEDYWQLSWTSAKVQTPLGKKAAVGIGAALCTGVSVLEEHIYASIYHFQKVNNWKDI